jgi:hypothetical protein
MAATVLGSREPRPKRVVLGRPNGLTAAIAGALGQPAQAASPARPGMGRTRIGARRALDRRPICGLTWAVFTARPGACEGRISR